MRLRLRAAILVLMASVVPALAQVPSPLGLDPPFLAGDFDDPEITIDLGDDGVTDLLIQGFYGVLDGTVTIPTTSGALESLVRGPDGRWRHAQSFSPVPESDILDPYGKGDLDGDGTEDLIVGRGGDPYDWGHRQIYSIEILRQDPPGELHRGGSVVLDTTVQAIAGIHVLDDGSGRVLVASRFRTADEKDRISGTMMQWRAESGWEQLWQAAPDSFAYYPGAHGGAVLMDADGPLLITCAYNAYPHKGLAIPIRSDGWGASIPFSLPRNGQFFELERGGERQVWCWSGGESDSLYQIVKVPGVDSILARPVAIEGVPGNTSVYAMDAIVTPSGDACFLADSGYRRVTLVELRADGSARWISDHVGPSGDGTRLLVSPAGAIEILWNGYDRYLLLSPEPQGNAPPSLPLAIQTVRSAADFDGDGTIDFVVTGEVGGVLAVWLIRGVTHPPWFRAPEPISSTDDIVAENLGDLDGDGHPDLVRLTRVVLEESYRYSITTLFWDGWRFQRGAEGELPPLALNGLLVGDYDGDGRDEILVAEEGGPPVRILRWNRDRTLAPIVEIGNTAFTEEEMWRACDVDGDGRDEVLGARSRSFSLWKLDPTDGDAVSIGSWINGQGFYGGGVADLSGDGRDDIYIFGWPDAWIWTLNVTGPVSFTRSRLPIIPISNGSFSAVDVDADGRLDLVGKWPEFGIEVILDPLGTPQRTVWVLPEALGNLSGIDGDELAWADVDRDGDQDLVVFAGDGIRVLLNGTCVRSDDEDASKPQIRFLGRNPAGSVSRVAVHADRAGPIALDLFDAGGRRVWSTTRAARGEGWIDVPIEPSVGRAAVPSGVYFLRLEVSGRVETKRIVLGF